MRPNLTLHHSLEELPQWGGCRFSLPYDLTRTGSHYPRGYVTGANYLRESLREGRIPIELRRSERLLSKRDWAYWYTIHKQRTSVSSLSLESRTVLAHYN